MTNTPKPIKGFFAGLTKKLSGVTTLLLTVTLLMVISLLVLFAGRYSSLQQKISGNINRNQQAFEAAQAGLQAAIPYFEQNSTAIIATASGGYLPAYVNASTANVALANGSTYSFVYANPTKNSYQLITITATGVSADGSATRNVSQQIQSYSSLPSTPTVSASTQGAAYMWDNAVMKNTSTNLNIDAGGGVAMGDNANTQISSGTGSNSRKLGSDVTQNDSTLSSMTSANYFQSIFGASTNTVQAAANLSYTNSRSINYNTLNGVTGSEIWINQTGGTATIDNNTVIGSATKPVLLIVNGNLRLDDNVVIYGMVFVLNPSFATFINDNAVITGGVSSTGSLYFFDNAVLNYNANILKALPVSGFSSSYGTVPGSWRDF